MSDRAISEDEVYRFIYDKIDTIPHMEALLQLWRSRPRKWTEAELAGRLFITTEVLQNIMRDLARLQLAVSGTEQDEHWYAYQSKTPQMDALVEAVAATYGRELLRVTRLIHSKASSGAREFGEAFRFRKRTE